MPMKRIAGALALAVLFTTPLAAQTTPEAAASEYLRVMKRADWDGTAALMHPAALDELKGFLSVMAASDSTGRLLGPLFGVPNAAQFEALSGQQVYTRLLQMLVRTAPEVLGALRDMDTQVLGSVQEGPDVAHVVYRLTTRAGGVTSSKVEVASFRRSGDRWMGLLSSDLRGVAQSLSTALQPQPEQPPQQRQPARP
jgi:hypothetical protein